MKKILKSILYGFVSLFLVLVILTGSINIVRVVKRSNVNFDYLNGKANKVILFIGDGMGPNQIKNTELYLDKELYFMSFDKSGQVTTHSKNTYWPTDSAAGATAMATGKKVYNTHIGSDFNKIYKSISEIAKENNLGVGIVTTDTLTGATPASFSAHVKKRSYTNEIILSQLENNIDLYLGAGSDSYINYKQNFIDKGYTYVSKYSELTTTSSKIIGSFDYVNNFEIKDDQPTLPLLTQYAINYFETNYPDGYFIMIEGAHIDKSNHSNQIFNMIDYLQEFDNSIKLANEMLPYDDVCFIVTADHESGNLSLAKNKEEISNKLYKSSDHTAKEVYYLIHQNNNEEINKIPEQIDNTHIFSIVKNLLNLK